MVLKSISVRLQGKWRGLGCGLSSKVTQDEKEGEKVTHFIFADTCYLVSLRQEGPLCDDRGCVCGVEEERIGGEGGDGVLWPGEGRGVRRVGTCHFVHEGQGHEVREVRGMKGMEASITAEADACCEG